MMHKEASFCLPRPVHCWARRRGLSGTRFTVGLGREPLRDPFHCWSCMRESLSGCEKEAKRSKTGEKEAKREQNRRETGEKEENRCKREAKRG